MSDSHCSRRSCTTIAAFVLAAAALIGTAEAEITTVGDVSPTYPSDDPEPPDPWEFGAELFVGETGAGEITINGGSIVSGSFASIGEKATAIGTAFVTGEGSKWESSDVRWVGNEGKGTLHIRDGGSVTNSHARIGVTSTSDGTAFVTGAGSTWENSHEFAVGFEGAGTLVISEGGLVTNNRHGRLGARASGLGTVSVTGPGSSWLLAPHGGETGIFAQLDVGESGTGILNITNEGLVSRR